MIVVTMTRAEAATVLSIPRVPPDSPNALPIPHLPDAYLIAA
jgi:hypothetical protein